MKTTLKGRVFTKEELKEIIQKDFIHSKNEKVGFWCLTTVSEDQLIGISGLLKCNYLNQENYEFGFILHENYWGKGLATEIGKFWMEYSKKELNLAEIVATVSPNNLASKKVLEKLKMECVGKFMSNERGERLLFSLKL